jgi:2-desacetyl-2-hydroxyethyl bacteriochlorophyllide A dehydrogenase
MRAAVVRGRGRVEITRRPVPDPGPGEARVRVGACGICGSDLHLFAQGFFPPGHTPGHEAAGWVDALGDGAAGPPVGAQVAVEPMRSCGRCASCRAGRYSICREARLAGVHDPGGLAEYLLVPASRLHRVPDELDARVAALAEPMAVVTRALHRGALAPGQRVLVLGAGAVGLLAAAAARALGAGEVWISARHPHQAARARALGATRVLGEAEATAASLDALSREAPVDLVVETVGGRADTLQAATAAVRPGGAVSVVGVFWGSLALDPMPLLLKEVTLAWSYCYGAERGRSDFAEAIDLLTAGRDSLAPLLTHTSALDDVAKAFADAADKRSGAVKVSVVP